MAQRLAKMVYAGVGEMTLDLIIPYLDESHIPRGREAGARSGLPISPHFILGSGGPLVAMQEGFEKSQADVLAYLHSDVVVHEQGWGVRVLKQFEDPAVAIVGFGGSLWHGSPDIYKVPYHISQLGRSYYMSNTDDAEVHGARFSGEREVATVDGFVLCIRRSFLAALGGWPLEHLSFHGYDHWATLNARRAGLRTRVVGIRCHHLGGLTSVMPQAQAWAATTRWGSDAEMHAAAHRWLFEEFRDVLPVILEA